MNFIYGMHAVEEALRSGNREFDHLQIAQERAKDTKLQRIMEMARGEGIPIRMVPREDLARLAQTHMHQGVVAVTTEKNYAQLHDLIDVPKENGYKLFMVLDGIEDPHDLGALLRNADGAGADGVVIPDRRAAGVNATVVKVSAGASEHVSIVKAKNIGRILEEMKASNIWIVGLDERGDKTYDQVDFNMDCAIVLGSEGKGLHQHVAEKCDFLVRIPMAGEVSSLNVSVAGAVVLFEAVRQRRSPKRSAVPTAPESKKKKLKGLGS